MKPNGTPHMSQFHLADQLKEKGNVHFRREEYEDAIKLYSQAIQQNPSNPLLYTNRANARLKLKQWQGVMDDCLKSLELMNENMKGFYFLGQAQLELNHPNEALSSALMAYELCSKSVHQTSSAFAISGFVVKCKKAKWDRRERERLWRRSDLLAELEEKLLVDRDRELASIQSRNTSGEIGSVAAQEETTQVEESTSRRINELRNAFAMSDPRHLEKRVREPGLNICKKSAHSQTGSARLSNR